MYTIRDRIVAGRFQPTSRATATNTKAPAKRTKGAHVRAKLTKKIEDAMIAQKRLTNDRQSFLLGGEVLTQLDFVCVSGQGSGGETEAEQALDNRRPTVATARREETARS